ncbi:MAG: rhodanese-like domain-containing protein [Proteobacteria bacterium]|nr:rhodanese-like domain-containing protein [Pseudomonadota bacterium]
MHAITVQELKQLLDDGQNIFLLDVREDDEVRDLPMKGQKFHHIPLGQLPDRYDELPHDRAVVVFCKAGGRSARAIDFLEAQHGFRNLTNLIGGMTAWAKEIDHTLLPA